LGLEQSRLVPEFAKVSAFWRHETILSAMLYDMKTAPRVRPRGIPSLAGARDPRGIVFSVLPFDQNTFGTRPQMRKPLRPALRVGS
jgi:hypothetical protein